MNSSSYESFLVKNGSERATARTCRTPIKKADRKLNNVPNAREHAAPMPRAPPVTNATRPRCRSHALGSGCSQTVKVYFPLRNVL